MAASLGNICAARRATLLLGLLAALALACAEPGGSRLEGIGARLGAMAELPFGRRPRAHDGNAARPPALHLLDTHESGAFNRGAAEIVDYHAPSGRAFVVNANAGHVDVLELGARGFGRAERLLEPRR